MQKFTNKTTNVLCQLGKKGAIKQCPRAQEESKREKEREKSYIPHLLPVDSNLSFKMAHTKDQRRLAN